MEDTGTMVLRRGAAAALQRLDQLHLLLVLLGVALVVLGSARRSGLEKRWVQKSLACLLRMMRSTIISVVSSLWLLMRSKMPRLTATW